MKTICDLIKQNREEAKVFLQEYLKGCDSEAQNYFFARKNGEGKWCYPDTMEECDLSDACPFVKYSDKNGEIHEYIVYSLSLNHFGNIEVSMVAVDGETKMQIPASWLEGYTEEYVYEQLADIEGLTDVL
jgi:hypothetical protein